MAVEDTGHRNGENGIILKPDDHNHRGDHIPL
jgi:hypothetical protein